MGSLTGADAAKKAERRARKEAKEEKARLAKIEKDTKLEEQWAKDLARESRAIEQTQLDTEELKPTEPIDIVEDDDILDGNEEDKEDNLKRLLSRKV